MEGSGGADKEKWRRFRQEESRGNACIGMYANETITKRTTPNLVK